MILFRLLIDLDNSSTQRKLIHISASPKTLVCAIENLILEWLQDSIDYYLLDREANNRCERDTDVF